MENVQKSAPHPLLIIAAVAVILFCAAGVAAIMGWIPKSGADADVPAPPQAQAAKGAPTADASKSRPAPAARPRPVQTAAAPAAAPAPSRPACADCGMIESVREIEKAGEASGAGAAAGGVLGGVVGHQMGNGRGQDLMTVVGAVGGAVAGHQIEKNMKKSKIYQITVRFEDGTTRVLSQGTPPSFRVGDKVKVVNGELRSNA